MKLWVFRELADSEKQLADAQKELDNNKKECYGHMKVIDQLKKTQKMVSFTFEFL